MTDVYDDEIVAEVRRVRTKLFEQAGGTLEALYARLKQLEMTDTARRVVALAPRPARSLAVKSR